MIPPREPPSASMPDVAMPPHPPAAGYARVVLDATDGPMRVAVRYDPTFVPPGGPPSTTQSGELCTTPCVADLPAGRYRLYLSASEGTDVSKGDIDDLQLARGTYVYRRAPGRYDTPSPTDQVLPILTMIVSSGAIIAGSVVAADAHNDPSRSALPGYLLIGAGVGGVVGSGIWAYDSSRAIRQEGATTFWQAGP